MRRPWPVAVVASGMTAAFVLTAVVLAAMAPTATTLAWAAVGGVAAALWATLGTVVARRERRNVVGALLALVGLAVALTAAREIGWRVLERHPERLPAHPSVGGLVGGKAVSCLAAREESSIWLFAALALLLLYFPDGRLPSARWRLVPGALIVTAFVHHAYGAVDPAPFQPPLEHLARPFGPPPLAVQIAAFLADV